VLRVRRVRIREGPSYRSKFPQVRERGIYVNIEDYAYVSFMYVYIFVYMYIYRERIGERNGRGERKREERDVLLFPCRVRCENCAQ
jgi:hypothetical protein